MNVFIIEMKAHRKSLIIWCIGVIMMVGSSMAKYVGMSLSGGSMNEFMDSLPKSLQAIWGLGSLDLSTVIGYYGVIFFYLLLMATIHAVMLGANIISKEERDKTTEFLLAKPISRNAVITSKLMASIINIVIFNIVTLVSSILFVNQYGNGASVTAEILLLMAGMFILQLIFLFIGTAVAAVSNNVKIVTSLSTGILLITFMFSVIVDLSEKLEILKYFTPFKYYDAKNLLQDGHLDPVFLVLSIGIIVTLSIVTYLFYNKRDLNT